MARKTDDDDEPVITNADWGKIHAYAWKKEEDAPQVETRTGRKSFREALETDPTSAVLHYMTQLREERLTPRQAEKLRIVTLRPAPCDVDDEFLEDVNPFPPSCC